MCELVYWFREIISSSMHVSFDVSFCDCFKLTYCHICYSTKKICHLYFHCDKYVFPFLRLTYHQAEDPLDFTIFLFWSASPVVSVVDLGTDVHEFGGVELLKDI